MRNFSGFPTNQDRSGQAMIPGRPDFTGPCQVTQVRSLGYNTVPCGGTLIRRRSGVFPFYYWKMEIMLLEKVIRPSTTDRGMTVMRNITVRLGGRRHYLYQQFRKTFLRADIVRLQIDCRERWLVCSSADCHVLSTSTALVENT